jgi:hypothetical protein
MDVLSNYNLELLEDLKLDQLNILDKQLMLPALKHKWVSRLIFTKKQKNDLEKKKKSLKDEVLKKIEDEGLPHGVPKLALKSKVDGTKTIVDISLTIEECDLVIEYLEKVEKILSSMTYDITNSTKLLSMELS